MKPDSEEEAFRDVVEKYGLVPVLIKRVTEKEKPEEIPSYTYGLLGVVLTDQHGAGVHVMPVINISYSSAERPHYDPRALMVLGPQITVDILPPLVVGKRG